jgi:Kef-type K+ transport system membrane component KefB
VEGGLVAGSIVLGVLEYYGVLTAFQDLLAPVFVGLLGLPPYAITALLFGFPGPEAIFIGTALTATSIAITANVLRELGKLKDPAAMAIIGAAVIDDVLSLLALSISNTITLSLSSSLHDADLVTWKLFVLSRLQIDFSVLYS